jgi:hypothetical protein
MVFGMCPRCASVVLEALDGGSQSKVVSAVGERGYRDGWTDAQFAARQIAKRTEELAEEAVNYRLPSLLVLALSIAGMIARYLFDRRRPWRHADVLDISGARAEAVDGCVADLCKAEMLGMDLVAAALLRSRRDAENGAMVLDS